ncbi:MAG: Rrf2 family transcriptional regulator [Clostridiales bacterium]|nr:Rrf2 family transcriptional regulator [Clostridiales bacterium]MCD7801595.1 Rrf2 family transcriptional regulator [Clostridiales bacterium]
MMISTRGRYALRIMVELALHPGEDCMSLKEIAQRQEISEKYLESIVKRLVSAGLVASLRGKNGGYRLTRPASGYTVLEVLELAEESLAPVTCLEGEEPCPRSDKCLVLPIWQGLNQVIRDYLSGITLEQLVQQTAGKGLSTDYI